MRRRRPPAKRDGNRSVDAIFKPGKIYVIRDEHSRAIKIGYTSRTVKKRLREFRTANPGKPTVLWSGPGTLIDETKLHRLLRPSRLRGEWFHDTGVVGVAIVLMQWYGAPFVADLELNMLETFVPTDCALPMFQNLKPRSARAPGEYFPEWSTTPDPRDL